MDERLDELDALLFEWESQSLDDAGTERLRELLRTQPHARERFVRLQLVSAALQGEPDSLAASPAPVASPHVALAPQQRPSSAAATLWARAGWLAVCAAILCIAGWVGGGGDALRDRSTRAGRIGDEPTSSGVALVTRLVNAEFGPGQRPVEAGESLAPGRFQLASGWAQLEFFCGATVVVEGPADLDLISAMRARVRRGRLRAHAPPAARGFQLETDRWDVVDLGTEFGLSVDSGRTHVHVFDGEVELRGARVRRIREGEGVEGTPAGDVRSVAATPDAFTDVTTLASRDEQQNATRLRRWRDWASDIRRDPRVVAFYGFDAKGDWRRRLVCAKQPRQTGLDGAIVGAVETTGRWPGKRALEFKRPADRVRVRIAGQFRSLTLACWTRIDSLDRWYNSLFLTDGYDQGEPHWQIMNDGRLYFSVRPAAPGQPGPRDFKALSPVFWKPGLSGKWIHLAVTWDVDSRTITHYLDGAVLSRHVTPAEQTPAVTRIGDASIGNWALPTLPGAEFAIRNLNGSIDEFLVFADALSANEIREIYSHGRP